MAIDPSLPRKILVIHGVQTSTNAKQNQHKKIEQLVNDRLNGLPLKFATDIYRYEDLNDAAQKKFRSLLDLVLVALKAKVPLNLTDKALDLVLDVVIALKNDATAAKIREGFRDKILKIYDDGNPCYVVAHSLGSVYALDVINELMGQKDYFTRNKRRTWPVQGLVTIGSPLGLSLFKRNKVKKLGTGRKFFRWFNYWDRTDPVVSGSFYGKPQQGYQIVERFPHDDPDCGWFIQDRVVDIGRAWLLAHVGYWDHPAIGDDLVTFISS
jgi:hypothetical protein